MTAEEARAASIFYFSQTYHYFFDAIKEATKKGKFSVVVPLSKTFFTEEELLQLKGILEDLGYIVHFSEIDYHFKDIPKEKYMSIRWDIQKEKGE